MTERGARLLAPMDAEASLPAQVTLELGALDTRDVMALALASDAVVLELRPLARAFA